jgi:hypothetical protein
MNHFARRFNIQPFVIYDEIHKIMGIYDLKSWHLQYVDDLEIPDCAADDRKYQRLWKSFYDSVAIAERVNHKQRRNFMPMRFWSNLTEMTYQDRDGDPPVTQGEKTDAVVSQETPEAIPFDPQNVYALMKPSSN